MCLPITSWCDTISLSLHLLLSWLCSLVPTCSRLMTFNHHPSQQGLSSRASHCKALDSRSVSQTRFYKALGFHLSGKNTFDRVWWSVQRNSWIWDLWSGACCFRFEIVPWWRCCGLSSYAHLQTQLDPVVAALGLQGLLPMTWTVSFTLEAFIIRLHSSVFWGKGIASWLDFYHVLFAVSLSLSVSPDLTVAKIKALILMALWLAGAHFPYYLRLFLLNFTVISIIDTHCNFQNCALLGLWLWFSPSCLWTAAFLCSVKFCFNPFNSYTEFLSSSSKTIVGKQNALLLPLFEYAI